MFATTSTFTSTATALIGTALFSAACVDAAIAPAKAATASSGYRASVERQIDAKLRYPDHATRGITTLAVTIGTNGTASDVAIVKSSGDRMLDREAVRTARVVHYPAGEARTIAMVLTFGQAVSEEARAEGGRLVTNYRNDHRQLMASGTTAEPNG